MIIELLAGQYYSIDKGGYTNQLALLLFQPLNRLLRIRLLQGGIGYRDRGGL